MRDIIISAIVMALSSSLLIAVGLRLLLAKRPFIPVSRWWIILGLAPMTINSIRTLWPEYPAQSRLYAFLIIGCLTILWGLILWAPRGGGIVIGATGTILRDALRHAFSRLGLPYEESAKAFRLPTLNNELFAPAAPIDGIIFLRLKRFRGLRALRQLWPQLTMEVNDFLSNAPVRINKRFGYALVVIGVAFLLLYSWLTYERSSLRASMRAMEAGHTEVFEPSEK
ncbi:MAG: hypothetical protein J2P21_12745 [Chloracidobacterium sp.]|nr:hypothetical protein [Chloracidobacterium sp.]